MQPKLQEVGVFQFRDDVLEAKIDAAKSWVNEPHREERRIKFQYMADLIAQRSPEYVRDLEFQKFGYYL